MKVGAMQPYLFPYIGYFQLIDYVDKWVVFDDTQYISKGWINRNRILHPDTRKEWQYISIPVRKHKREARLLDIEINNDIDWRREILGKLTAYKRKAPFYRPTIGLVEDCFDCQTSSLSEIVGQSLKLTCEHLDVRYDPMFFSKMNVDVTEVKHSGQWALVIAKSMGATEYINPPGGYTIFAENEFEESNIGLKFLKPILNPYVQRIGKFVPGLSIIDILMWNDVNKIRSMLKQYQVLTSSELAANDN